MRSRALDSVLLLRVLNCTIKNTELLYALLINSEVVPKRQLQCAL
jgi:hypothetical protein